MADKKYKILKDNYIITKDNVTLYRIQALKDIKDLDVKKGDIGGYIQQEKNLSQTGRSWVRQNAKIEGNAKVNKNALIAGHTVVSDEAVVTDNAIVMGGEIKGSCKISEKASITNCAYIGGNAVIKGNVSIYDSVIISGNANISGYTEISDHAAIRGNAKITGSNEIEGHTLIKDNAILKDSHNTIGGYAEITGNAQVIGGGIQGIVKDNAKVINNSVSSGAIVQGNVIINKMPVHHGTITEDIYAKKDWGKIIHAMFGIPVIDGKVILYTLVKKDYSSWPSGFVFPQKGKVKLKDINVSFGSPYFHMQKGDKILAVEIKLKDLIDIHSILCRVYAKKVKVLGAVDKY